MQYILIIFMPIFFLQILLYIPSQIQVLIFII